MPGYLVPTPPAAAQGGTRSDCFAGNHIYIYIYTLLSHTFVLFSSILSPNCFVEADCQPGITNATLRSPVTNATSQRRPLPSPGSLTNAREPLLPDHCPCKREWGAWEHVIITCPTPSRNRPGHPTKLVPSKCLNKAPRQVQVLRLFVGRPPAQFALDWQTPNS